MSSTVTLVILSAATAANIVLAVFVYKNNPKGATNRIFGLLGFLVSAWLITLRVAQQPTLSSSALFWTRLSIFIAAPMSMTFFLLAHTIPHHAIRLKRGALICMLVSTAIVMVINISPFAFTSLEHAGGDFPKPVAGPGMLPFGVLSTFFSVAAIYTLFKKSLRSQGVEREQFRFVMTGILLLLSFVILTIFLPVVFFNEASLVPLAPLYALVFLGMTAYAIIKHRLLDIRLILARAISFLLLIAVGAGVYALVLFVGVQRILGIQVDNFIFVSAWLLTTVAMLTFQPLQRLLRRFTNKIFFKDEYDSDKLLGELTRIMVDTIDIDELTKRILRKLMFDLKINEAAFLIIDNHKIVDVKGIGYNRERFTLTRELEELFHQYIAQDHHFIFDDLRESSLKNLFRQLNISAAIPIRVENAEVAILVLGTKSSGETYSDKDIRVLDIFASQAGIAIQNAKAYAEIKKFSKELEIHVEERTKELQDVQGRELAKAQEVARLKDEFVFVAAHELRTPVAAIRGFLEMVSEGMENFPKDVQHNLGAIAMASGHLNQLINDLLEISRSEAGAMKTAVAPAELVPIVKFVVEETAPLVVEKHVVVSLSTPGIIPKVLVDVTKIREVIMNLVSNAIKYNKKGGRVDISVFRQGDEVVCEIRDTGYGIPPDEREKVFGKFFRAHAKGTEEVLGTGLGLFITRMLVEKMGGSIMFTSVEGEGTTFAFAFPIAK